MATITNRPPASLPVIGTTWQTRRWNYWARRVLYSLLMAVAVACETGILAGVWQAIDSTAGHWIFAVIEGVFSLATGTVLFNSLRKSGASKAKQVPPQTARRAGTSGALLGVLARAGSIVGSIFLVLGSLLTYGLVVALFVRSLLPRLDSERAAQNKL